MLTYIALLRAINAGPGSRIKMETLRQAFQSLGFTDVLTFQATGNVRFDAPALEESALARQIEAGLRASLGLESAVFLRTPAELARAAAYEPFPPARVAAAAEACIIFLASPLSPEAIQRLEDLNGAANQFHPHGREIFWLRFILPGRSAPSGPPLEPALGVPFTVRGASAVRRMAAAFGC